MARSRSRSRKRKLANDKTFIVKYYYERWELEPNVYIVKAKNKKEAEDLVLEYYARKVIDKNKYPTIVPDEYIVKEFIRIAHLIQDKKLKNDGDRIYIDKYSFDFSHIKSETTLEDKVVPVFLEDHGYY